MRDIGYTLGDIIEARAELLLVPGQRVDEASLPATGRVSPWLELRAVQLQKGRELLLQWQVFATVETPLTLHLPAVTLKLAGPGPQTVTVAPLAFQISPVLPVPLVDRRPRPAPAPEPFDETGPARLAGVALAVGVVLSLAALWLADMLPGLPRRPGPFTQLRRWLRRHPPLPGRALEAAALRQIHQALNKAAGQTLYPDTLHVLFVRAPAAAAHRSAIESFFAASWAHFFEGGQASVDPRQARTWIDHLARAERLQR